MLNRTATTLLISCLATSSAEAEALAMTSVATIDVFAVEPLAGADKGPQWIKLAPRGPFTARDARKFTIDPELLVERFNADKVALPIDVDHATVKKAMFGEAAPAIGWIEELQARPDGLYGRVEWLEPGLAILAAKSHRFISPALKTDDHGRAYWLHSAGLVAAPGISMPAVASANPTHTETNMLKAIAKALNLQEDANEAACLSAIGDMLTKRVDPAIHQQALDQVKTLGSELESIKAVDRKSKVDGLLEGALAAKKISPAQRESYEALCATDSGFEQVSKLIETLGAGLAPSDLDNKRGGGGDLKTLSAEDRTIIKEMGLSEEEYRQANGLDAA